MENKKEKQMTFFEQLEKISWKMHEKFKSWMQVNLIFGLKSNYYINWAAKKRCVITPAFIEGLQACGYTLAIVPYTEEVVPERKKDIKEMSIYDIVKLAEAEGVSYGDYIKTHDVR